MLKLRNGGKRKIPQKTFNTQRKRIQIRNELPLHPPFRQNIPPWPCQCISVFLLDLEQTTNQPRSWLRHDYRGEGVLSAQESGGACRTRETRSLAAELAALRTRHLQSHQHPALNHQGQGAAPGRTEREEVWAQLSAVCTRTETVSAAWEWGRGTWMHTAVSKGHPFHPDRAEFYIKPPHLMVQGSFMLSARLNANFQVGQFLNWGPFSSPKGVGGMRSFLLSFWQPRNHFSGIRQAELPWTLIIRVWKYRAHKEKQVTVC